MTLTIRAASLALAFAVTSVPAASAQSMLAEVMARHGVVAPGGNFERAFDEGMTPSAAVTPGSLATPLALMTSTTGPDRNNAAYAFGILAGRGGQASSSQELAAAGQALVRMIGDADRRARIAGARVAGRVFALPFDAPALNSEARRGLGEGGRSGLIDALFAQLNRDSEIDQLVAMDALGLMRTASAVTALTDRYLFYRTAGKRDLAGGALEALARIGDASTIQIVKGLAADPWAGGRDATALAVAFARERMLADGSVAAIRAAADDRARRFQALGYLAELGVPAQ
jgi:hypothetical protein